MWACPRRYPCLGGGGGVLRMHACASDPAHPCVIECSNHSRELESCWGQHQRLWLCRTDRLKGLLPRSTFVAKNTPKRKFGKYIRGNVDEELALTTLASKDVVGAQFDEVVNERTYVSKIVATYSLSNFTLGANIGPFIFGVAHGDYDDAEVEEWLEQAGQWNEGNLVSSREIGRRLIRQIGVIGADVADITDIGQFNDGKMKSTKLGWTLMQGQTLRLWAFNAGSQPVATSSLSLTANGHVNLWPR